MASHVIHVAFPTIDDALTFIAADEESVVKANELIQAVIEDKKNEPDLTAVQSHLAEVLVKSGFEMAQLDYFVVETS